MGVFPALPSDYESWIFPGGAAAARRDVAGAVSAALATHRSLYAWAAADASRQVFHGRGETYGVPLGPAQAVIRHARRGGALAGLLRDRYLGQPRFLQEIRMARRLSRAGIPTPDVLAGVAYGGRLMHRADVATERADGEDLAAILFGPREAPAGEQDAVMDAVGLAVGELHRAGFLHPDLQLRNVLVARGSGTPARVTFLDVDTCRPYDWSDTAAARRNVARFRRSWDKWNRRHGERLTAADWERFQAAYARAGS